MIFSNPRIFLNYFLLSLLCFSLSACASNQAKLEGETKISDPQALSKAQQDEALCTAQNPEWLGSLNSVWDELRKDFRFSEGVDNSRVRQHLAIYDRRQRYFNIIGERGELYLYYIKEEVKKRDMPSEIALLPVIESSLDPFAYSHGRAAGMWQFIPSTGRIFKLEDNWWYEGRRDVVASTQAALNFLERLHKQFDGDWLLALAAYNSGPGTVKRAMQNNEAMGKPTDFWSLSLPKETSDYVPKLIALSQLVMKPEKYSIELRYIPNAPYFDEVDAHGQIDLSQAANLADVDTEMMYLLNPGFNRWASDPDKNRHLLVPWENRFVFEHNLEQLPKQDRLAWKRYTVKSGDTLSNIADRNKINTDFLKSVNNLSNNNIRIGDTLMIPKPLNNSSSYSLSQEQRKQALSHRERSGRERISYTVQANDSFWSIGKKHNVGVRELAAWNGMAPGDTLKQGEKLNIWVLQESSQQRSVYRKVYYTVKSGDSLSRIASRFNVNVNDIRQWNNLQSERYLKPGQQLVLNVNVAK